MSEEEGCMSRKRSQGDEGRTEERVEGKKGKTKSMGKGEGRVE